MSFKFFLNLFSLPQAFCAFPKFTNRQQDIFQMGKHAWILCLNIFSFKFFGLHPST